MSEKPNTNMGVELDVLKKYGDPLEQFIYHDLDDLNLVLNPYANIWYHHVCERRLVGGAFLVEAWQPFGSHHYTALVRLHHAFTARTKILELCEKPIDDGDYATLLDVHSALTTFWENIGATIDNLLDAKTCAKRALGHKIPKRKDQPENTEDCKCKTEHKVGRTISSATEEKLAYAFQRRTQYIHSILVPKTIRDGEIVFDLQHYKDEVTDWSNQSKDIDDLTSRISKDWEEILSCLSNNWNELYSWLQKHDQGRPKNEVGFKSQQTSATVGLSGNTLGYTTSTPVSGSVIPIDPSGVKFIT